MNFANEVQAIVGRYGLKHSDRINLEKKLTKLTVDAVADLIELSKEKAIAKNGGELTKDLKFAYICLQVANVFDISIADLFAADRKRTTVLPRQLAQVFLSNHGFRDCEISRYFGQNHATIFNAKKKIENLLAQDELTEEYKFLKIKLSSNFNPLFLDNGEMAPQDCEL